MRQGRQKCQTKAKSIINDPSIAPYKILVEEDQYVLVDGKDIPQGYFTSLDTIIKKISRTLLANKREEYNFSEFIESYNQTANKLLTSFKNTSQDDLAKYNSRLLLEEAGYNMENEEVGNYYVGDNF